MKQTNLSYEIARKSNIFERSSEKPVKSFVAHQSMPLCELVRRFESGQRLNVKMNFDPGDQFTRDHIYEEDFEDAPPDDVHDIVDVENALREHEAHKAEYSKKKKESKQAPQEPSQQAQQEPQPPDPAVSNQPD